MAISFSFRGYWYFRLEITVFADDKMSIVDILPVGASYLIA